MKIIVHIHDRVVDVDVVVSADGAIASAASVVAVYIYRTTYYIRLLRLSPDSRVRCIHGLAFITIIIN